MRAKLFFVQHLSLIALLVSCSPPERSSPGPESTDREVLAANSGDQEEGPATSSALPSAGGASTGRERTRAADARRDKPRTITVSPPQSSTNALQAAEKIGDLKRGRNVENQDCELDGGWVRFRASAHYLRLPTSKRQAFCEELWWLYSAFDHVHGVRAYAGFREFEAFAFRRQGDVPTR